MKDAFTALNRVSKPSEGAGLVIEGLEALQFHRDSRTCPTDGRTMASSYADLDSLPEYCVSTLVRVQSTSNRLQRDYRRGI